MAFDLKKDKEDLRSIEDGDRLERQKEYNRRQKGFAKVIGENFATYALLMILALLVGFIWTDIGIFTSWTTFIGDAVVTVVLYILADIICASYIGGKGGKLDEGYISAHNEYLDVRGRVRAAGMLLMDMFCDWQIDVELEFFLRKRCKDLKIDYREYIDLYRDKSLEELQDLFPIERGRAIGPKERLFGGIRNAKTSSKAAKIFALNQIKPIELTPDILMTDGKVRNQRGDVGISGEEYIEKHTTGIGHIITTVIFAIVAVVPTFTLAANFSVGMVIYTVFKIALMLFRMYRGYSRGAKAFNTIEPRHLQAKTKYLYMYLEFLKNKTYLEFGEKYGTIGTAEEKGAEKDGEGRKE
jgi:hypothetical protein